MFNLTQEFLLKGAGIQSLSPTSIIKTSNNDTSSREKPKKNERPDVTQIASACVCGDNKTNNDEIENTDLVYLSKEQRSQLEANFRNIQKIISSNKFKAELKLANLFLHFLKNMYRCFVIPRIFNQITKLAAKISLLPALYKYFKENKEKNQDNSESEDAAFTIERSQVLDILNITAINLEFTANIKILSDKLYIQVNKFISLGHETRNMSAILAMGSRMYVLSKSIQILLERSTSIIAKVLYSEQQEVYEKFLSEFFASMTQSGYGSDFIISKSVNTVEKINQFLQQNPCINATLTKKKKDIDEEKCKYNNSDKANPSDITSIIKNDKSINADVLQTLPVTTEMSPNNPELIILAETKKNSESTKKIAEKTKKTKKRVTGGLLSNVI